jgi:hypothetical protein
LIRRNIPVLSEVRPLRIFQISVWNRLRVIIVFIEIRAHPPAHAAGVISSPEVVVPRFCIPFFAGIADCEKCAAVAQTPELVINVDPIVIQALDASSRTGRPVLELLNATRPGRKSVKFVIVIVVVNGL